MSTDNVVTPICPDLPDSRTPRRKRTRGFNEIYGELWDTLQVLHGARALLDESDAVDGCESASKAREIVHRCLQTLDRVRDALEGWHVTHDHTPKDGGAVVPIG